MKIKTGEKVYEIHVKVWDNEKKQYGEDLSESIFEPVIEKYDRKTNAYTLQKNKGVDSITEISIELNEYLEEADRENGTESIYTITEVK